MSWIHHQDLTNIYIYLLENHKFLDNNFLMIKESNELHAPTSVLFYEVYSNEKQLVENISPLRNQLQCILSTFEIQGIKTIEFGKSQEPTVFDFADDVNTLDFLNTL